ncbi:MAG TPA: TrmH family RNA methyltransferase [Candidatus Saccharimonadales bacterium]|nr:TrmH family RNA methyltransferase [Candidatus Saccharimonadales bacterium]
MRDIVLIVHNIRSAVNVGGLFRTADGLGVNKIILSGYTPYPISDKDGRLPHLARKVHARIIKTALGAEKTVVWSHSQSLESVLKKLKTEGYQIAALEQSISAIPLNTYPAPRKVGLLVGNEVGGIDEKHLQKADVIIEIPMRGRKESFNVSTAAAMALYHLSLLDKQDS